MKQAIRALAVAAALCMFATTAEAREYVVHSCKLPDGRPAPTDGWSAQGSAPYMWFEDHCAGGGGLVSGIGGDQLPTNHPPVGWGFRSGSATIRGYRIVRSGTPRVFGSGASMVVFSADGANSAATGRAIDYCAAYQGCGSVGGLLVRSAPTVPEGSHGWYFSLGCGGDSATVCRLAEGQRDFGSLRVDQASFTLDDDSAPTASSPRGSLDATGATSGSLIFTAVDSTSGVRRATIESDGVVVAQTTPDRDGGRCAEVGQSALPDFTLLRPCPQTIQAEISLPTGALANGTHLLSARVYDAAGNGTTVWGPRTVVVAEQRVGATATARFVPDGGRQLKASYGRRPRVSGVLIDSAGGPLAGAEVIVTMRAPAAFTSTRTVRLVTDGAGRYALRVNAVSSRAIDLTHRASGASLEHRLTVQAPLRLRAASRRIRPLGRMRLTGELKSERTRRKASVAIKVMSGRSWRTVGVTRADTRGRFAFAYRFRRTRHASFTFRAVAVRSGDLAVSPTPSNRVRIRVG